MAEITQPTKKFPTGKPQNPKRGGGGGKLRGLPKDSPVVRLSKTLSWLLRHGAQSEGLTMRADGYVKVIDLLENPKIKSQALDLTGLQQIVNADSKQRYSLVCEDDIWWIKANQGHSIKAVKLDLKPIFTVEDIPSRTAVHGTTKIAWQSISSQGLSKMTRNHIHLAQGVTGNNVISGMRKSCDILIFIDVPKALAAGITFFLSDNGVVLTEGNDKGFLEPAFFLSVQNAKREALAGWEGDSANTLDALNPSNSDPVLAVPLAVPASSTLVPSEVIDGIEHKLGDVKIRS
ncbi:KptA family-domain-containing protein [Lentinula edodes]|uniref:KptA family-domain-containing protein n=1 Tax=Lentinula edodes TaxID=5353 RepID=UPI001E8D4528|nr:KptA family-domain-containing protein [Lentinula edodes]KAH7878867.1 KptA family-domain-containing protein [Lentinula edodes]